MTRTLLPRTGPRDPFTSAPGGAPLPGGPREPVTAQTLEWALRPTAFLRRCARQHGETFTIRLAFDDAPLVCTWSPRGVADVLAAPADVLRRGESPGPLRPVAGPRSILLADGAEHLRIRRLMLPPFHGARLRAMGSRMAGAAAHAAERWPAGRPVALLDELQRLALDIALDVVLGADGAGLTAPVRATLDRVGSAPRVAAMAVVPRDLGPRSPWGAFLREVATVDDALGAVIADRREHPAAEPDVLGDLLGARDADGAPLTDREIRDHVVTLLAAGHETTAGAGAWALERLARAPAWAARIRAGDDEALDAVVHETLRVRPVLTVVPRKLAAPLEVDGRLVPAGVHVAPCIYLVQRHPALWGPDAAQWRPERWLGAGAPRPEAPQWIPFGGGVRRCVGAAFSLLELREVLRAVLMRWALEPERRADERMRRRGVTLQPERGARVVLSPAS